VLIAPEVCNIVTFMSNKAVRNHRHWRRCIVTLSVDEPFLTTFTTPGLPHLNAMLCLDSILFLTAQLNRIGTSSFAIMPMGDHSADQ